MENNLVGATSFFTHGRDLRLPCAAGLLFWK